MLGNVVHSERELVRPVGENKLMHAVRWIASRTLPASIATAIATPAWFRPRAWAEDETCTDANRTGMREVTDVHPIFFPRNDPAHYKARGAELQALPATLLSCVLCALARSTLATVAQACLASHAALLAHPRAPRADGSKQRAPRRGASAALPAQLALGPSDWAHMCGSRGEGRHCMDADTDAPVFCLTAGAPTNGSTPLGGELIAAANISRGWAARAGGRGGSKVWLHASDVGSLLRVRAPTPARAFKLEVYRHHELGLGRLRVHARGLTNPALIDTCCAAPVCPGIPRGQGAYATVRVPAEGYLPSPTRDVEIDVVRRPAAEPTRCAVAGSQISLKGLIGVNPVAGERQR